MKHVVAGMVFLGAALLVCGPAAAETGYADSAPFALNTTAVSGANDAPPTAARLEGCRPNPFNPSTSIVFVIAEAGPVHLAVYDLRGRLVRTLLDGPAPAGRQAVPWDGRDAKGAAVAGGVYLCRIRAGAFTAARSMTLVK